MLFKYWIEFDEDGEIKELYKSKYECKVPCKEYIVKLIPIDRKNEELTKNAEEAAESEEKQDRGRILLQNI
jgi:hypothetical protein